MNLWYSSPTARGMKKLLIFAVLVGITLADAGWNQGTVYTYNISSKSLSSFKESDHEYFGVFIKGFLKLQTAPTPSGSLSGQIIDLQYAEVNTTRSIGCSTTDEQSSLHWKEIKMSNNTFGVIMNDGLVKKLMLRNNASVEEANIIRAVISQLQVDLQGKTKIASSNFSEGYKTDNSTLLFSGMEETMTGLCETVYHVSPMPQNMIKDRPTLAPLLNVSHDFENIIDIMKVINFNNCQKEIVYNRGIDGKKTWDAGYSNIGSVIKRKTQGRLLIEGDPQNYTIHSSVTTDKFYISPSLYKTTRAISTSCIDLKLVKMEKSKELVYIFNGTETTLLYDYMLEDNLNVTSESLNKTILRTENKTISSVNAINRASHGGMNAHKRRREITSTNTPSTTPIYNTTSYTTNTIALNISTINPPPQNSSSQTSASEISEATTVPTVIITTVPNKISTDSNLSSQTSLPSSTNESTPTTQPHVINDISNIFKLLNISKSLQKPILTSLSSVYPIIKNKTILTTQMVQESIKIICEKIASHIMDFKSIIHGNILNAFCNLTSIISNLEFELLHNVSNIMHHYPYENEKLHLSWVVFRDAVAQAGTGPALMLIKEWVLFNKTTIGEAEDIIGQLQKSVKVPNEHYIDALFEMVTDSQIQRHQSIHASLLLSFTSIINSIFVTDPSHNIIYPAHIMNFRIHDKNKLKLVYLPYLEERLKSNVLKGDDNDIHVYIRALGNVAHPAILNIFNNYLKSNSTISLFQKVLIIISLERIAYLYPAETRNFLFPILIDKNEHYEVRSAAVFQIMQTKPPINILHKMAESTQFESSNQVIAAVKSSIQYAAQLTNPEDEEFRENSRSVLHLLNPKSLGVQFSHHFLISYQLTQLGNLGFFQSFSYIGSENNIIPKGIFGTLERFLGGLKTDKEHYGIMFSDIQKTINVFENVWNGHKKNVNPQEDKEKKRDSEAKKPQNISSTTASQSTQNQGNKFMEEEENMPESIILFPFSNAEKFVTFGRNYSSSIEYWLQQKLKLLKEGYKFNHSKLFQRDNFYYAVPNVAGFIVQIDYRVPTIHRFTGKLKLNFGPTKNSKLSLQELSQDLTLISQLNLGYASNKHTDVTLLTPFNGKQYSVGYKEQLLINIPISANITFTSEGQRTRITTKLSPIDHNTVGFYCQYNTQSYKQENDLVDLFNITVTEQAQKSKESFPKETAKQYRGFHLNAKIPQIKYKNEPINDYNNKYMDLYSIINLSEKLKSLNNMNIISQVYFPKEESSLTIHMLYDQINQNINNGFRPNYKQDNKSSKFLKENPTNNKQFVSELQFIFDGEEMPRYLANLSYILNDFANYSSFKFSLLKKPDQDKCHHCSLQNLISFILNGTWPKLSTFDFSKAMSNDPTSEVSAVLHLGISKTPAAVMQCKFMRTSQRKTYLMEEEQIKKCKKEMDEGNMILPSCQFATTNAYYLDQHNCSLKISDLNEKRIIYTAALNAFSAGNKNFIIHPQKLSDSSKNISYLALFTPSFQNANISIIFPDIETIFTNISIHSLLKPLIQIHPSYSMLSRTAQTALSKQYNPTCALDKTKLSTFDNKIYPIHLGECWHVAMALNSQYTKNPNLNESETIVLVRDNSEGRVIRILTEDNVVDISPQKSTSEKSNKYIFVNNKQYHLTTNSYSHIVLNGQNRDRLIYGTIEDEKIKLYFSNITIRFDGLRVLLTLRKIFLNQTLGLCGTFTGEESDDFILPTGCNIQNPNQFTASYAVVNNDTCTKEVLEKVEKAINTTCSLTKDIVISSDFPKNNFCHDQHKQPDPRCLKRYIQIKQDHKYTCFSQRELPKCKASCYPTQIVKKNVSFHCVSTALVSKPFIENIKSGKQHNFGSKETTKNILVDIPTGCYKC